MNNQSGSQTPPPLSEHSPVNTVKVDYDSKQEHQNYDSIKDVKIENDLMENETDIFYFLRNEGFTDATEHKIMLTADISARLFRVTWNKVSSILIHKDWIVDVKSWT